MNIFSLIQFASDRGASDLHMIVDSPPVLRVDGSLRPAESPPLTQEDMNAVFAQLASEDDRRKFEETYELDFGRSVPGVGRIRCNASKQRGTTSFTIRLVRSVIPGIDELGLPSVCKELVLKPRGLIIVSGPTGSGKSTTLSAMVNHLNKAEGRRVVTIEDPVEFVYTNDRCTITQRELGSDTRSFAGALKYVLRQDPDVILVGEMRDYETAAAVFTVAETGHLVLTTGHANGAAQAVERIIDLFPGDERPLAQARLASFLLAIMCQALVPRISGSGRVAAVEVMLASPAIKNTIREGRIYQLPNAMMTQAKSGMTTLDNALVKLYRKGVISQENMFAVCNDPEEVSKLITRTAV